jgi:alkylation response protein AidB-like acyl-CoA dehydrogenase
VTSTVATDAPTADGDGGGSGHDAYRAPVDDVLAALDVAGLDDLLALPDFSHVERDAVALVLAEFGRLAAEVIAPTDRVGDRVGARFDRGTGRVTTPEAFHVAYRHYVDGGWGALPFPEDLGGGGFPSVVALALQELFASANLALSLNPVLTQGAIHALAQWGSPAQQAMYLPRLLTGAWSGTMNLTEPDAGSDLGEIRTLAEPDGDGTWRLTGTKIFITWGEHDLTDNVVHLVLARTPGAAAGTRGLSLFVVPKRLVTTEGVLGEANAVSCVHVERKLGIHGSPTCVMAFDGAVGELVGPLHGGMRAMFTMMNAARLSIGAQGPAVAERAFQHALAYAGERLQGRAAGVAPPARSPIVDHPDVRRMLLVMRTRAQAARSLLFLAATHVDRARHDPDPDRRERSQQLADLLTPVAKAWSTDSGLEAASLGVQVLGGAGYLEEAGMAQRLRDGRVAPIYEGTNGIQALDLVTRKLPRDGGRSVHELLADVWDFVARPVADDDPLAETLEVLASVLGVLEPTTEWVLARLATAPEDAVAGATAYLELLGTTLGGWLLARRARLALDGDGLDAARAVAESNFFATEVLARATGLARPVTAGAARVAVLLEGGAA